MKVKAYVSMSMSITKHGRVVFDGGEITEIADFHFAGVNLAEARAEVYAEYVRASEVAAWLERERDMMRAGAVEARSNGARRAASEYNELAVFADGLRAAILDGSWRAHPSRGAGEAGR